MTTAPNRIARSRGVPRSSSVARARGMARTHGFSMIEIMVGMTIGLIGIVIIMQIFTFSENQKRTTTSGSDAQNNGNIAMYSIVRDLRQAGYGLNLTTLGCLVSTSFGGNQASPGTFTLAPVVITDGGVDGSGNGLADTIQSLYSTTSIGSLPSVLTVAHAQSATTINVQTNFGFGSGNLLVFWESGKNCALAQVTGFPNSPTVLTNNSQLGHSGGLWNGNTAIFPATGYAAGASLINLGGMALRTISVDAGNNLLMTEVSATFGNSASSTFTMASEIVNLQAMYGKDNTADGVVDVWNNTTPNAGVGNTTTAANWKQIIAVRIALLARSGQFEKPPVSGGACDATTTAPRWSGGTMAVPGGLPSCYRYKVYETVVPLRNIIWGQ
ncbi:MAG: prepilin-type N-terminal cleavage/methylation domain-containing protein [Betaproteobacteria bacterium]|nr:prepilin-type N-terminal cleavage/methylation domain-containing protein [Betaproteobacteria bacterium]